MAIDRFLAGYITKRKQWNYNKQDIKSGDLIVVRTHGHNNYAGHAIINDVDGKGIGIIKYMIDYAKIGFWQNLKIIYVWTVRLNSILAQNPLVRKRVETFQSVKTLIKLPARCVALKRFNRHKNRSMSSACPTCDICRLVAMHIYRRIHMRVETIQQAHKRRVVKSVHMLRHIP